MVSILRNLKFTGLEKEVHTWGKAELRDKWIILHKNGGPKMAIYYKDKSPKNGISCRLVPIHKKKQYE
jgi:hypothetical protein